MGITSDEHVVEIGGATVTVAGRTGAIHATWTLSVDGREADRASAAGDFTLRGSLPDGSEVRAEVHQGLLGDTKVVVHHGDDEVASFDGYVA